MNLPRKTAGLLVLVFACSSLSKDYRVADDLVAAGNHYSVAEYEYALRNLSATPTGRQKLAEVARLPILEGNGSSALARYNSVVVALTELAIGRDPSAAEISLARLSEPELTSTAVGILRQAQNCRGSNASLQLLHRTASASTELRDVNEVARVEALLAYVSTCNARPDTDALFGLQRRLAWCQSDSSLGSPCGRYAALVRSAGWQ